MTSIFENEEKPIIRNMRYKTIYTDDPEGRTRRSFFDTVKDDMRHGEKYNAQVTKHWLFEDGSPYKILRFADKELIGKQIKREMIL